MCHLPSLYQNIHDFRITNELQTVIGDFKPWLLAVEPNVGHRLELRRVVQAARLDTQLTRAQHLMKQAASAFRTKPASHLFAAGRVANPFLELAAVQLKLCVLKPSRHAESAARLALAFRAVACKCGHDLGHQLVAHCAALALPCKHAHFKYAVAQTITKFPAPPPSPLPHQYTKSPARASGRVP